MLRLKWPRKSYTLTLVSDLIRLSAVSPEEAMRSYIGKTITTYHGGRTLEYKVQGLTSLPLKSLTEGSDSLTNFFSEKLGYELKCQD
jgi:hypothetical protein